MFDFRPVVKAFPDGLRRGRVLVIGDVMLDVYVYGTVQRLSPEAPVPIIRYSHESQTAGGCANVALNIAALGARPMVAGCIGDDLYGHVLKSALQSHAVDTACIQINRNWPTIRKTRLVGNDQQITRIDHESRFPAGADPYTSLWPHIEAELDKRPGVVVLSDYAKGVLTPQLCQSVICASEGLGIPVIVDPKGSDYSKYAGCVMLTPNIGELATAARGSLDELDQLFEAGQQLRTSLQARFLLVTRGRDGMTLLSDRDDLHIPTRAREVYDVSGAGDTVIGTIAAAMACGVDLRTAVHLGNAAAGIVVAKRGTATVSWDELATELSQVPSDLGRESQVA